MSDVPPHDDQDGTAPAWPPLPLDLRQPAPGAWTAIVRRARRRRQRTVALSAVAVVLAVGVPAGLALPQERQQVQVAHRPAQQYSDVCDVPFDRPAPEGDQVQQPFRAGGLLVSPASAGARPVVAQATLLARARARGMQVEPGTQLRYAVVRRVQPSGSVGPPLLRWVLTACGRTVRYAMTPRPTGPTAGRPSVDVVIEDEISLLTDSGAMNETGTGRTFDGVCATRLDDDAPDEQVVDTEFTLGELRASPPPAGATLPGRDRVLAAARARGAVFPGTQVRLALTSPVHTPGTPRLRWVVTTCGLDGASVRPTVDGVTSEALVYDSRATLLGTQRASQRSAAVDVLARTTTPESIPTFAAAGPNMCGPWSHAYPDFKARAAAAGYTNMQGCYLQAHTTVVYVSSPTRGAAAAVFTATGKAYQDVREARFPYRAFTLVPAPHGATAAELFRLLSPTVAEVRLSGSGQPPTSWKFDAGARAWQQCADMTGTATICSG